jgi:hypothetical protein
MIINKLTLEKINPTTMNLQNIKTISISKVSVGRVEKFSLFVSKNINLEGWKFLGGNKLI